MNDVSVTEGNAGSTTATFSVTLSAASGQAVTVDWATSAGSATAGTDYVTASGSRTIAAGATTATIAITVDGDALDEANETFDRHAVQPRERHDRETARGRARSPTTTRSPPSP